MDEIVSFFKEVLMLNKEERTPIGLCAFDAMQESRVVKTKPKRKREMRLSELMDR